jgi:cellulose 1,4-beta-cellobiosidase
MIGSLTLVPLFSFGTTVYDQRIGTQKAEVHPSLSWQKCISINDVVTCTNLAGSVVLDANWRCIHSTTGYTSCYTGKQWDTTLPGPSVTGSYCAANCAVDGADYSGTYGITTSGSALLNCVTIT